MAKIRMRVNKARKTYSTAKAAASQAQGVYGSAQATANYDYQRWQDKVRQVQGMNNADPNKSRQMKIRDGRKRDYDNSAAIASGAYSSLMSAQATETGARKSVGRWTNEAKKMQARSDAELVGDGIPEQQKKKKKARGKTVLTGSLGLQDEANIGRSFLSSLWRGK